MTVPKYANPVALLAAAALYVTACLLPGEPSDAERVVFTFDFEQPYRVPLAGVAQPLIQIAADGQVLQGPNYRLESLDPSLVRVDPTGRSLAGIARGTATVRVIYATATGAPDTTFAVQVVVSRVAVSSPSLAFTQLGATSRLTATAYDANDAAVSNVAFTWSSLDPQVATVNDTGLVRAVGEGTIAITATADGVADSAEVSVTQVAAAVRIAPELDTLRTVGRSAHFFAVALDSTGRVLEGARPRWTSSDPTVAIVDGAGRATATGAGLARIIARVGEAADTGTLVVAQVTRFLVVTPGFDTLTAIADTAQVVALAFDSLNFPVPNPSIAWATSDAAVATVDQAGLVRAAQNGVVLVTAAAGGQSAFATVVVRQEVAAAQLSADRVALVGEGDSVRLSAVGLDRNGYLVAGASFRWRSGSECVATVDAGLVTARGGGETAITAAPANGGQSDTATVSVTGAPGRGGEIAFNSPRGIEVICSGGGGRMVLIESGPGYTVREPAWSPDGSRLAFTRTSDDGCAIYTVRADGSEALRVTDWDEYCGHNQSPAWSPDGTKIAFSRWDGSCVGCQVSLYVVNADGSNAADRSNDWRLVDGGWFAGPTWSPDGTKLAFEALSGEECDATNYCYQQYHILVANADFNYAARVIVALTSGDGSDGQAAWSPDGSQIAFERVALVLPIADGIWLINPDGSGARVLTGGSDPAWSPDGSRLVFVQADGSQYDLYIINRDGTGLRRLTSTPEYEARPSWGPAPSPQASAQRAER